MASFRFHLLITLSFFFYIFLLSIHISADEDSDLSSSSDTEVVAECGPRLLPLASCATFVQGTAPSPAQACCDNLIDLYDQQPSCLCMLLNQSSVTSFPINKTLALQLPTHCKLAPTLADCPGLVLAPGSPESRVFHDNGGNASSFEVSPTPLTPKTNMGVGLGRSGGDGGGGGGGNVGASASSAATGFEGDLYAHTVIASVLMEIIHFFF